MRRIVLIVLLTIPGALLVVSQPLAAQTLTAVVTFNGTDGAYPHSSLIQATDGYLYGTTSEGGAHYGGTVYRMTPGGALQTLYMFCAEANCTDGTRPIGGLVQAVTDGALYGTTQEGGIYGYGTVFRISRTGQLTTLYSFDSTHGSSPNANLIQGADGAFYGTASYGGARGYGTVFSITPEGSLTTLHSFNGADGAKPYAGLVETLTGEFYGATRDGGTGGDGTIYKITRGGVLTTLHNFSGADGANPYAGLIQASDGNLYGATVEGGASGYGTLFKVTPGGTFTTLYDFHFTDGAHPYAGLVQGTDGNFYGTTLGGGTLEYGTTFQVTSQGTLTTLHDSCSVFLCADGAMAYASLIQLTSGDFYGPTRLGGASKGEEVDLGTVVSLSVGLGPFVELQRNSGKAGSTIRILGSDLIGTTLVTFNGVPAEFEVVSASEISAVVPQGASSGIVQVTTPGGVLESNRSFHLRP